VKVRTLGLGGGVEEWGVGVVVRSLYGSETRGLEDDSVESKHVALI